MPEKYKSQQDKSFQIALDRIELFQYYCSKCDNDFTKQSSLEGHICKPSEGDALNFAIKVTKDHINSGSITITSVNANENNNHFSIEDLLPEGFTVCQEETFEPMWVVRPGHGKMYGKKYILDYKPFLKNLFEIGEKDPSKKMSPSRMLQSIQLDSNFSLRLDHPSETEIRSFVSSLIQSAKRKRKMNENPDAEPSTSRVRLDITSEELEFIKKIAQESQEMKPVVFYQQFIDKFPATALTSAQVKAKFGTVKRANKK